MDRLELLKKITFGSQVAEEEIQFIESYFVETDQWNRLIEGKIDIVRGEKGSGKSALYLLLEKNRDALFDRKILIVSGENPRGATVFRDLISDPPTSEAEFIVLWKLYILTIVCFELREFGIESGEIGTVFGALEEVGLLERKLNLAGLLRAAQHFARRLLNARLETGVELDPLSGTPSGIIGRISLGEPPSQLRQRGVSSINGLFEKVNTGLRDSGYSIWVLLDRLDVAFAESHELEANAIRALVRVYGDLRALEQISLKIFLREDIWKRVTLGGFREASHITRFEVMKWTAPMLLNLTMRRVLSNQVLTDEIGVNKEEVLKSSQMQENLFSRLFPSQVRGLRKQRRLTGWLGGVLIRPEIPRLAN